MVYDFLSGSAREIILVEGGDPQPAAAIDRLIKSSYIPNSVIVKRPHNLDNSNIELKLMPWLKEISCGEYDVVLRLCRNGSCQLPAEGMEAARKALEDFFESYPRRSPDQVAPQRGAGGAARLHAGGAGAPPYGAVSQGGAGAPPYERKPAI